MKKFTIQITITAVAIFSVIIYFNVCVLTVNNSGVQKTLVLWGTRDELRFVDSISAVCKRRGATGNGVFATESKEMCAMGVMAGIADNQGRIIARLPFSEQLSKLTN